MKGFLLKTFVFLAPVLLLFVGLEIAIRQIPNDYEYKNNYLKNHADEIETLILGSSHSFYGVDPTYFTGKTFNASHSAQTLDYDYEIVMKYKDEFHNLKTVLIPVSYFSLWDRLENGIESWRCKNYVLYYGMEAHDFKNYSEVLSNSFENNVRQVGRYAIKQSTNLSCSELGWGTEYKSEKAQDLDKTGKKAALRHTIDSAEYERFQANYSVNSDYVKKIVQWCESKNVKVILFTPPAFETYRKNLNAAQLAKAIETANEIAAEFDNCTYVNLMNDSTFVEGDFFDADHLSEVGAKKLSMKLNELTKHERTATLNK